MKHLFLFLCLILYSCEYSGLTGTCEPIMPDGLSFNSQGGIDSTIVYGYNWWFTDVEKEEGEECEFIEPEKIECPWFSAEKAHDSTIIVSVKQNDTGQKRTRYVHIKGKDGPSVCRENSGGFIITQCPRPIDMELSKKELLFSSEGGTDKVIMNSYYYLTSGEAQCESFGTGSSLDYCNNNYCKHNGNINSNLIMKVECFWFSVTQIDENTLLVSVNKNETGKERQLYIGVRGGNCDTGFLVYQSAE